MILAAAFALGTATAPDTSREATYKRAPAAIHAALAAPQLPAFFLSPTRDSVLLATPSRYPPIGDLARPMLRLAGLRIDPATNGIHHAPAFTAFEVVRIADGKHIAVALPAGGHASAPQWNPDGSTFAFTIAGSGGAELYIAVSQTPM